MKTSTVHIIVALGIGLVIGFFVGTMYANAKWERGVDRAVK